MVDTLKPPPLRAAIFPAYRLIRKGVATNTPLFHPTKIEIAFKNNAAGMFQGRRG